MDTDSDSSPADADPHELTPGQKSSLRNAIDKQKKLQDGSMKKTKLTKAEKSSIKSVEDSGAYDVEVGPNKYTKTRCVVYPALTDKMIYRDSNYQYATWFVNLQGSNIQIHIHIKADMQSHTFDIVCGISSISIIRKGGRDQGGGSTLKTVDPNFLNLPVT